MVARGTAFAWMISRSIVESLQRADGSACQTSILALNAAVEAARSSGRGRGFAVKSGKTSQVRRSSKDLDTLCRHPENPDATARAISRANVCMFDNINFGGRIGAIIDHNKGTADTYPTWVQLGFGKTPVFDRSVEKEGLPTPRAEPAAAK